MSQGIARKSNILYAINLATTKIMIQKFISSV